MNRTGDDPLRPLLLVQMKNLQMLVASDQHAVVDGGSVQRYERLISTAAAQIGGLSDPALVTSDVGEPDPDDARLGVLARDLLLSTTLVHDALGNRVDDSALAPAEQAPSC